MPLTKAGFVLPIFGVHYPLGGHHLRHRSKLIQDGADRTLTFLQAENRLLKERLHGKRIRFTDAERALLARRAKAVGRKALLEVDTIVSPDTLLRWHRRLVARNASSKPELAQPVAR
jgi:hypothetical protein